MNSPDLFVMALWYLWHLLKVDTIELANQLVSLLNLTRVMLYLISKDVRIESLILFKRQCLGLICLRKRGHTYYFILR